MNTIPPAHHIPSVRCTPFAKPLLGVRHHGRNSVKGCKRQKRNQTQDSIRHREDGGLGKRCECRYNIISAVVRVCSRRVLRMKDAVAYPINNKKRAGASETAWASPVKDLTLNHVGKSYDLHTTPLGCLFSLSKLCMKTSCTKSEECNTDFERLSFL